MSEASLPEAGKFIGNILQNQSSVLYLPKSIWPIQEVEKRPSLFKNNLFVIDLKMAQVLRLHELEAIFMGAVAA
jgi:hypothetical protein